MGSAGDTYENLILDAILGANKAPNMPATVYAALYTAAPTDAAGGTEVTGGAYARVAITNNGTNWPAAASSQKKNGVAITFPTATAGWGNVTHFALWDHLTATALGNFMLWGALAAAKNVLTGDTPSFAVNAFIIGGD